MHKFLYLTEQEWVNPWIHGGEVPIFPASTYLARTRYGTQTPDENLIHESPVDLKSPLLNFLEFQSVNNLTMIGCSSNDVTIPDFYNANYYMEDGLILSFCNKKSSDICSRLGKKACVKINDIDFLKGVIDSQLGVKGIAKNCGYTQDHQRNHFLKSIEDAWQDEYRIFWLLQEQRSVLLPEGIGRSIKIKFR